MLNPQSPTPLYHQLADLILGKIRSGEYPPGFRIPSEHALAATHGIGRPTVRQALELLVRKRILARRRGSGTYVQRQPTEIDLFSLAGTLSAFHKEDVAVTTQILHRTRLITAGPDGENPFAGRQAYFLSRVTRVEEQPVLIEDIYLHAELFAGMDALELEGRSLSQIVRERFHMKPVSGKQSFRIVYATGRRGLDLAIDPSTPILLVKRFLHFPQTDSGIYAELYCRTDRFVFAQSIVGMTDD
jgi:GntR family transcriptional regulator